MITKLLLCLLLVPSMISNYKTQFRANDIIGIWLTSGKEPAKIQIYKSVDKYYGKIVWLANPMSEGKQKVDRNNPEKSKQIQPIIGLVILKDFRFDDDEWQDGTIYDPESGRTYDCNLTLKDKDTLHVRGYIGISLFGRTEKWIRAKL